MSSALWFILMATGLAISVTGIALNACTVVWNVKRMKEGVALNVGDQVCLSMALMNILLQGIQATEGTLLVVDIHLFSVKGIYSMLTFLALFLTYSSYWLTTWLSAFYCIKIANFNHRFLASTKRALSASLPRLLHLSILGSFVLSIPSIWEVSVEVEERPSGNVTLGSIIGSVTLRCRFWYTLLASLLGCGLPVLLTLHSLTLTISSLLRHIQNMKQNDSRFGATKLQSHVNAIKTMVMFLSLVVAFYLTEVLCFTYVTATVDAKTVIGYFFLISFPTVMAVIIFQANSKLRIAFVTLCCFRKPCNKPSQDHSTEKVDV